MACSIGEQNRWTHPSPTGSGRPGVNKPFLEFRFGRPCLVPFSSETYRELKKKTRKIAIAFWSSSSTTLALKPHRAGKRWDKQEKETHNHTGEDNINCRKQAISQQTKNRQSSSVCNEEGRAMSMPRKRQPTWSQRDLRVRLTRSPAGNKCTHVGRVYKWERITKNGMVNARRSVLTKNAPGTTFCATRKNLIELCWSVFFISRSLDFSLSLALSHNRCTVMG